MKLYKPFTTKWRELVFILILSFFSNNIKAQNIDSLITWDKNYKLTWNDFLGSPNYKKRATALSFLEMLLIKSYVNDEIHSYTIIPTFNRFHSYSKLKNSYNLLKHEQLHFDIQEIFARKLRKQFEILKKEKACEISFQEVFNEYCILLEKYQYKFDISTNYSSNSIKQEEWNSLIIKKLKDLELYNFESYYLSNKN